MVPHDAFTGRRLQRVGALESDAQFPVESPCSIFQFVRATNDFAISASRP